VILLTVFTVVAVIAALEVLLILGKGTNPQAARPYDLTAGELARAIPAGVLTALVVIVFVFLVALAGQS
jgi:hypothetical protein